MIDPHSLQVLEFNKIVSMVSGRCLTPSGKEETDGLRPLYSREVIDKRLDETAQMQDILKFGQPFPLTRLDNCLPILDRAKVENAFLDPVEFRSLLDLLRTSAALHKFDCEGRENMPALDPHLRELKPCIDIEKAITSTIDERGEIRDNASPQLKKIRNSISATRGRLISRLEQLVHGKKRRRGWQDDVVTQRNGRYVISIVASEYNKEMGILHDRSQSGNTLFVEPKEGVELNNQLNLFTQEERLEIDRILRRLTSMVAERSDVLAENYRIIGHIDAIHAAAEWAVKAGASRPIIRDEAVLRLREARHPLLIAQLGQLNGIVPLDIAIDSERRGILVTGPNTGGKTVALKTCGLLLVMAQSGLPIPANDKSEVGIFSKLFADIGDEQSIEQSLSTFSSHIRNVITATSEADASTLVLLDEIGAGTDPKEGAALAEAVILHILESGAKLVVTTHYSQLKTLPLAHDALENASMEFDRATLAPTFQLQIGIPGSSYAVEVAERLGMDSSICERANKSIGSGERSLNELIASLESELTQIRADRTELTDRLSRARTLESYYEKQTEELDGDVNQKKETALNEAMKTVATARKEVERLIGEIRKSQASRQAVKDWHSFLKQAETSIARELDEVAARSRPRGSQSFQSGELVRIISLNQEGQIEEVIADDKARVRIGSMNMVAEFRNMEKLSGTTKASRSRAAVSTAMPEEVPAEIHLRGMTVEEALESLDRYLDRAVVAGLGQVYVIHGKGTGTLRRTLTEYLRKHREVESLQLGNWNEGGAGVTVVKLKT